MKLCSILILGLRLSSMFVSSQAYLSHTEKISSKTIPSTRNLRIRSLATNDQPTQISLSNKCQSNVDISVRYYDGKLQNNMSNGVKPNDSATVTTSQPLSVFIVSAYTGSNDIFTKYCEDSTNHEFGRYVLLGNICYKMYNSMEGMSEISDTIYCAGAMVTASPTLSPSKSPTLSPSQSPTQITTEVPTMNLSRAPEESSAETIISIKNECSQHIDVSFMINDNGVRFITANGDTDITSNTRLSLYAVSAVKNGEDLYGNMCSSGQSHYNLVNEKCYKFTPVTSTSIHIRYTAPCEREGDGVQPPTPYPISAPTNVPTRSPTTSPTQASITISPTQAPTISGAISGWSQSRCYSWSSTDGVIH